MTLREKITEELLYSIGDPAGLEDVLKRHSRSKGPLYLGLAQATTGLCERLAFAFSEIGYAEEQKESLAEQVETLGEQHQKLQESVQRLNHEVREAETKLGDIHGILDRVDQLAEAGFGGSELLRLSELIPAIAGDRGITFDQLAKLLDQFGSVEAMLDARQGLARKLGTEVSKLEAQVEALVQERESAHQAIVAVKENALQEVQTVEKRAKHQVDTLLQEAVEVGKLRAQAEELGDLIKSARLLKSGDPEKWKLLPRVIVQHLLMVVGVWAAAEGRDVPLTPPRAVSHGKGLLNQATQSDNAAISRSQRELNFCKPCFSQQSLAKALEPVSLQHRNPLIRIAAQAYNVCP